jgi:hypothetical protein
MHQVHGSWTIAMGSDRESTMDWLSKGGAHLLALHHVGISV